MLDTGDWASLATSLLTKQDAKSSPSRLTTVLSDHS